MQSAEMFPYVVRYSHVDDPRRESTEELFGNYVDLMKDLRDSYSEIEMFASPDVLEAATKLRTRADFAAGIGIFGRTEIDERGKTRFKEPDEMDEAINREFLGDIERLRGEFIKVARKELGVDSL